MKKFNPNGFAIKKYLIRYSDIILVGCLVIVTIWYAISTHRMLNESRRQFELLNRAYISIIPYSSVTSSKQVFSFGLDIDNGGKTPGTNVIIQFEWPEKTNGQLNIPEIHKTVRMDSISNFSFPGISIFPGQGLTLNFSVTLFTKRKDLIASKEEIYLTISVFYSGLLSKPYRTQLRLKYYPERLYWEPKDSKFE